ncbi:MAG: type VII toxin-antitoxin system HepT family RNase toxin [Thermodesulfovibrionales bacterium]
MIDKNFLKHKLICVESYYREMERVLTFSDKEIKEDFIKLRALERILQLIVDEIIDINNHIIRYKPLNLPADFQSTFLILAENKIIPEDFAKKIAPVVGLRNRLIHRYEKIDLDLLIQNIRKNKGDFKDYAKYIFHFLEKE